MSHVSLIVLSSGFSTRLGRNKLLQVLNGRTVLQWTLNKAIDSSSDEIVVVVEPGNEEIRKQIPEGVTVVENPERRRGISSAIRFGLQSVGSRSDAVLFLVGDQPFISVETLNAIIEMYRKEDCAIVACRSEGIIKNPILFSSDFYGELMALDGDQGARKIALSHIEDVCTLTPGSSEELIDIDTESDLMKAEEIASKKEI